MWNLGHSMWVSNMPKITQQDSCAICVSLSLLLLTVTPNFLLREGRKKQTADGQMDGQAKNWIQKESRRKGKSRLSLI